MTTIVTLLETPSSKCANCHHKIVEHEPTGPCFADDACYCMDWEEAPVPTVTLAAIENIKEREYVGMGNAWVDGKIRKGTKIMLGSGYLIHIIANQYYMGCGKSQKYNQKYRIKNPDEIEITCKKCKGWADREGF